MWSWNGSLPLVFLPPRVPKENIQTFSGRCHRFSWPRCPSCHPTNSVKALKETQSIDPNQVTWPRSFFIHYGTPEWKGVSLFTPKGPTPVQCLSVAIHATHVQVCGAGWKSEINIFIFKLCSITYVRSRGTHMHVNDLFSVTSWQCNRMEAERMNRVKNRTCDSSLCEWL